MFWLSRVHPASCPMTAAFYTCSKWLYWRNCCPGNETDLKRQVLNSSPVSDRSLLEVGVLVGFFRNSEKSLNSSSNEACWHLLVVFKTTMVWFWFKTTKIPHWFPCNIAKAESWQGLRAQTPTNSQTKCHLFTSASTQPPWLLTQSGGGTPWLKRANDVVDL